MVVFSVNNCVLLAIFSVSCFAEQTVNIDLRNIGLPVYISKENTNETLLFEDFLKYAHGKYSSLSLLKMEQFEIDPTLTEVTGHCQSDITFLRSNTNDSLVTTSFYKYIDATAKIPQGILQGKWNWVGDYQECYDIDRLRNPNTNKSFGGKYFSAGIVINGKPVLMNTFPLVVGVCLPSSCNKTDVVTLLNQLIAFIKKEIAPVFPIKQDITVYESISDGPKDLGKDAIVMLVIIGLLCFIVFVSTLVDYLCSLSDKEMETLVKDDSAFDDSHDDDRTGLLNSELFSHSIQEGRCPQTKRKLLKVCRVFSVLSNGKKLFGTATAVGPLACLNGIRVLSMWWVILGHTYAFIFAVLDNIAEAEKLIQRFSFQPIMNGTYSVDSFFFLSGLLVAYLALKEIKEKGKLSWPYYFIHRYWRLTPLYAFVLFYYAYVFSSTISGPLLFFLEAGNYQNTFDVCKTYWWTNLLYINNMYPNYGNLATTCVGWSWYLANDMQFYIVFGPIVILALSYKGRVKHLGVILTISLIFVGVVVRGILVWYYGIYGGANGAATKHKDDPWGENGPLYGRPYARYSVYLVGMLTGYVLSINNNRIRLPKITALFGWCVAIATGLAVIYGQFYYNRHTGTHMTLVQSIFYNSLGRTAWGMCLAWVVIACVSGNGGPVKDILSWQVWAPLGRLTYAAYLVHPIIMYTYYFNMRQPLHFSDMTMVYLFISHLVVSYVVAFSVSMLVEAPMIQLEKLLLQPIGTFANTCIAAPCGQLLGKIRTRFNRGS
ncbi:nose resistant to fluoxetine protein 6-like [Ruditapes philippinarum]|uniref:nose resistant to fluoxetine protein 6-like n=1 Tax=Ruditapes philippinarum TaxID=129788 RepID=UPI00295AD228|nr:nose resistant to fluoxetine protein 6-like [Ruditapes philippinarum]